VSKQSLNRLCVLRQSPVIGIGVVIAFPLAGLARRSSEPKWVSLKMFVALALLSIAVYLTGSPASHQMRELPGISREAIHHHSSAADFAFGAMETLGAFSLRALIKFRNTMAIPTRIMAALLALAFVVFVMMIGRPIWEEESGTLRSPVRAPHGELRRFEASQNRAISF
jgi:hypothetical protein